MSTGESEPMLSVDSNPPSGASAEAAVESPGSNAGSQLGARTWSIALIAGLAAGTIAWGIGERMLIPELVLPTAKGTNTDLTLAAEGIHNAVVAFGVLGAVMGVCAGVAGGVLRRSVLWTILAAATGFVLGGGAGMGI